MRIALALHVAGSEETLDTGLVGARDWIFPVVDAVIPQNFGFRRVGGRNLFSAVEDAMRLVEVHRLRDVARNDGIVLPDLGDAVDLHGEQNGNPRLLQVASEQYGGCGSPTVAEDDNASPSFFFSGEATVVIDIEQAHDRIVGTLPAAVFKDGNVGVLGRGSLDSLGEANRAVVKIVVAYEAAHETDDNAGGNCRDRRPEH